MREKGELDVHLYAKMKHEETVFGTLKRPDVIPKEFPTVAEEMRYPKPVLNKDNPLYLTSNNSYGSKLPSSQDMAPKFYPKDNKFTDTFLGGIFLDTGLNTHANPSKVH